MSALETAAPASDDVVYRESLSRDSMRRTSSSLSGSAGCRSRAGSAQSEASRGESIGGEVDADLDAWAIWKERPPRHFLAEGVSAADGGGRGRGTFKEFLRQAVFGDRDARFRDVFARRDAAADASPEPPTARTVDDADPARTIFAVRHQRFFRGDQDRPGSPRTPELAREALRREGLDRESLARASRGSVVVRTLTSLPSDPMLALKALGGLVGGCTREQKTRPGPPAGDEDRPLFVEDGSA